MSTVPVVTGATSERCCGNADCPDPGDCPGGSECLPSNYIDPADCPPGCDPGEACLPETYIDPADCPITFLDSPGDIADLAQWYDASDDTTFTFLSGDQVDTWADKSGNAHTLTAYQFDADRPTRIADALNGRAVVADTDSNMTSGAYARGPGPLTIFAVASWDADRWGGSEAAIAAADVSGIVWRASNGAYVSIGSGGGDNGGNIATLSPHIVTTVFDGASSVGRVDLAQVFASDLGDWEQTQFSLFSDSGGNRALRGYIAELLVYDRALTADEIDAVEDYLLRKWLPETGGVVADYVPYALVAHSVVVPSKVQGRIIADLSPYFYYPMDEAAGNLIDASGNGRDASSFGGGTINYAQPGITSKRSASIEFEGGYVALPIPFEPDSATAWTMIWLEYVIAFQGAGSPSQASALVGAVNGSNTSPLCLVNTGAGDLYNLWGVSSGQNFASYVQNADLIGRPAVICLTNVVPTQPRLFIDGVCWGSAQNTGTISAAPLCIGASNNGFWGYPLHRMSDFAFFDRGLTITEIQMITQALMDKDAFATSLVPS